jgi:hypothetical protein
LGRRADVLRRAREYRQRGRLMGMALEKLGFPPAAFDWDGALLFTGVGEKTMREWIKAGKVRFIARGPNGSRIARRQDLEAAVAELFATVSNEPFADLDFGDD